MTTNLTFNGGSPFRIKRPLITTSGFVSDVDATIKSHLDELNDILGRRVLHRPIDVDRIKDLLASPLTPKRIRGNSWSRDSIVYKFKHIEEEELPGEELPEEELPGEELPREEFLREEFLREELSLTLSDYIDMTADLSALKYEFQGNVSANWFNMDYNTKAVLDGYPAISDYLIAYAYHVMDLKEVNGLKNFILSNRNGAKRVANYAIVSAARTIIHKEQLKVDGYDTDDDPIVDKIKAAGLSLSAASFKTALHTLLSDYLFNSKESKLIDGAGIGVLPPGIKPLLIKYIKSSPVPINEDNVKFFLPLFISQIKGTTEIAEPTEVDTEESDKDFDVEFLEDDTSLIKISVSAVKCAAQLYYGMVLGDELDVFNTVNYFTHKYLIRGGIEIQDSRLRDDLQMYVFSNRFMDLKTKKIVDRTRPAERQMFYRQVFDYGNARITDDFILNKEFTKLWKVLILESAKYLERAQVSPNPDSYVSRQNVMQAVEDLQYNLSAHCTGMANVITPLIYAELNFVIQRIFMHREIRQQIVPAGGTWWRVVETLYMGMKHMRPKATVLYNKAKLGYEIIRSIADYNPATFEDDRNFSAFISNVDAFITTQSILQEALTDDLKTGEEEAEAKQNGWRPTAPETADAAAAPGAKTGDDEWDF